MSAQGSPPRMRGKRGIKDDEALEYRITPADAGKTQQSRKLLLIPKDHPRGCGENLLGIPYSFQPSGSPPRMRGKPMPSRRGVRVRGITPADAGKTRERGTHKACRRDHPRGCGENVRNIIRNGGIPGSPPRMRGKQLYYSNGICSFRITPADAGKTAGSSSL